MEQRELKHNGIKTINRASRKPAVRDVFRLVIACADEADQKALYERLAREGRACKVLTLCS